MNKETGMDGRYTKLWYPGFTDRIVPSPASDGSDSIAHFYNGRSDHRDRAVACVNACAGIPTASLTPGSVAGLREALEPFALLTSTVDFSRWDAESPIEILTPSTRKTRGSHQLTLAEVIRARAALAACPVTPQDAAPASPPAAPVP